MTPIPSDPSQRGAVVITGASSGIGKACALHLDGAGFIVFAGVRREEDGKALRSQASDRLRTVLVDVTDSASIELVAETVSQAVGDRGLAGLVNNAGVVVPGALEFLDLGELRRQLEVNVVGQIAVTQAFLGALRTARGRVVNIGSIGGRVALPFVGPYHASKFAMEALTDTLRIELHPWGIEVSIIEPGSTATEIWTKTEATADAVERSLPARGRALYGDAIKAMRATSSKYAARAIPASRVARAVEHALTAKRPKTRYVVGPDARLQAFARRVFSDRILDGLIRRQAGLPQRTKPAR
jgi:NAD(P)-dependent dehydrogenase (short-subunit alcohol dehydrogenase family)